MALKTSNLPNCSGEATSEIHEVRENKNLQIRQQKTPYRSGATFWPEKAETDVNLFPRILL